MMSPTIIRHSQRERLVENFTTNNAVTRSETMRTVNTRTRGITEGVNLPVNPPVLPMLAKRVIELPPGESWLFEPKWYRFRALIFRDHDEIFIQSRDEKPLGRYFPELLDPIRS